MSDTCSHCSRGQSDDTHVIRLGEAALCNHCYADASAAFLTNTELTTSELMKRVECRNVEGSFPAGMSKLLEVCHTVNCEASSHQMRSHGELLRLKEHA